LFPNSIGGKSLIKSLLFNLMAVKEIDYSKQWWHIKHIAKALHK
jgi:hypothetical protein